MAAVAQTPASGTSELDDHAAGSSLAACAETLPDPRNIEASNPGFCERHFIGV
jgi:hypothetical protein